MKEPLTLPIGKTAIAIVDMQEEHRRDARYLVEGYDHVLANVAAILAAARAAGTAVYHFAYVVDSDVPGNPFHPVMSNGVTAFSEKGSPWTETCGEVASVDGERLVIKSVASALANPEIVSELQQQGIEWLVVAGVWTEACIHETVKDAQRSGFRVLLVKDACGSGSRAMHETAVINLANRLYGGGIVDSTGVCLLLAGHAAPVWQVEGAAPLRFGYDDASSMYESL